ncbi:DUF4249 domain-containing protein [Reichenbachiella versicolor]|uniref:DUF4249 domain-containing protein n=1 Tax=Reichenbachiella versicolor TaxID=1821036 RepID=UPI000D6E8DE8|nr:DUF4249 domain-containing protein [Reichenbachiella versicolor]
MNRLKFNALLLVGLMIAFVSCTDEVNIDLKDNEPVFTVDAWLDNLNTTQTITLTRSTDFFDNEGLPPGVTGAEVYVTDGDGIRFDFVENTDGRYVWNSSDDKGLGTIGQTYTLTIVDGSTTYSASTTMLPTTSVDTVYFVEEEDPFEGDYVRADFQALDRPEIGNTYWVKAYKNGEFLYTVNDINIAYDAAFSESGGEDQNGVTFIPPIRFSINDFDEIPIYEEGDVVKVEIHSISEDAFDFLNLVIAQSDREAGFGALFEAPLNNVTTNITSSVEGELVMGMFNIAAVAVGERQLVLDEVLPLGCFFTEELEIECPE